MSAEKARFLQEVTSLAALPAHVSAEDATEAVLHALAGRLTRGGGYTLLRGLPPAVALVLLPFLEERVGPPSSLDRSALLDRISGELDVTPAEAEIVCRAVLNSVRAAVPVDVAERVAAQLPADWRELCFSMRHSPKRGRAGTAADIREAFVQMGRATGAMAAGDAGATAFAVVMQALLDRLSGGEVRHVALGLPVSFRHLVSSYARDRAELAEVFDFDELVGRVARALQLDASTAERVVYTVFDQVKRWLPLREIEDVASQLPPDIKAVWLGA